ncbi:MAG: deoxyribodipyrimidine photo-lyase [Algoriphagus sp.]|uniref:cryptochrome/photolyase family protein n=1 Tax=Algoriphagus sp. TaxID=1872435 RepID=UPI0018271A82|nr:deoxyribodipyrimidine photo-lyase [Algoriphagus sp.]NVJ85816.1 deoxyribodipyrimidine photo-lyase [Algoriphagus sp.]
MEKITLFWFRRDLRLDDNSGLFYALQQEKNVLPLFIFDLNILEKLEDEDDARVGFIHDQITKLKSQLEEKGSSMIVRIGKPLEVYQSLLKEYSIQAVYTNRDYEPYAKERDEQVSSLLNNHGVEFFTFKDQMIFEPGEILNGSGEFYKVFTPFSKIWLDAFKNQNVEPLKNPQWNNLYVTKPLPLPSLEEVGFKKSSIEIPPMETDEDIIRQYDQTRNYPAKKGTSRLGIHLRFGTISIRKLAKLAAKLNATYLNELIWREFYMTILAYNPQVVDRAFKPAYDQIPWRNNEEEFKAWCEGKTGYPIVDAGMRELNATGYMHNRVRMIVASFLTKHLLIDWRWGEAYFARKLLDFELASNNGGWQWAAGTGTDAQPYFRVFNPESQTEKFDKDMKYIKKWVPELGTDSYPKPIVDHKFARQRAINTYKEALNS